MSLNTMNRYANKLETFLSRQFRNCVFTVMVVSTGYIVVMLKEGDFYPVAGDTSAWELKNLKVHETIYFTDSKSAFATPQKLSNVKASSLSLSPSPYKLSEEAKEIFFEVFRYIATNFSRSKNVSFAFTIGNNYINNDIGTIAKPTEIDHKTFKGRKRRSVAEAIVRGWEGLIWLQALRSVMLIRLRIIYRGSLEIVTL